MYSVWLLSKGQHVPIPTDLDIDSLIQVDRETMTAELQALLGEEFDAARRWFADLGSLFEDLVGSIADPSHLYRLNEFMPELEAHCAKLPIQEEKLEACFEIILRAFPEPHKTSLTAWGTAMVLSHSLEMKADLPASDFCKKLVARFDKEVSIAWEKAKEVHLAAETDGVLRLGSRLKPHAQVTHLSENESRDGAKWLACWVNGYESEIAAVNTMLWLLAQNQGHIDSDMRPPMAKGKLFAEACDVVRRLGPNFPFFGELPRVRNALCHGDVEQVSRDKWVFFDQRGQKVLEMSTEDIANHANADVSFAASFDMALILASIELWNEQGRYDAVWAAFIKMKRAGDDRR